MPSLIEAILMIIYFKLRNRIPYFFFLSERFLYIRQQKEFQHVQEIKL